MDIVNELFTKFGLDGQLLIALSGAVLLIVNILKDKAKLMGFEITGVWTQLLSFVVSFGLSYLSYSQSTCGLNWIGVSITAIICWLGPDSINTFINRKVSKITG